MRFLEIAALLNAQQGNGTNIAREAGIPRPRIEGYFSILVDTPVGYWQADAHINKIYFWLHHHFAVIPKL